MALLDIAGKATNAPVYRVLGGPTRNKVRALTTASLSRATAAGFRAIVIAAPKPAARNQGQAYERDLRQLLEPVRSAGAEIDFVLDGGGQLTPGDAANVAMTLEPMHPLWFDDPVALLNAQTIRKIADESVVPLGFGRGITNPPSTYQELLRESLIDILRPDISREGISRCRRIAALAEPYYVAVAPRHDGGPVATAAALHLAASLPNFFIQYIPLPESEEDIKMRTELVGAPIERVREGFASLPTGPGLGINVNEAALEKYHAA
jgi:galactonate dehydratase